MNNNIYILWRVSTLEQKGDLVKEEGKVILWVNQGYNDETSMIIKPMYKVNEQGLIKEVDVLLESMQATSRLNDRSLIE